MSSLSNDQPARDDAVVALETLRDSLIRLRKQYDASELEQGIYQRLHNTTQLPDKGLIGPASQIVDLLHEFEQMLQPAHLVLADHFLGYVSSKCLVAAVSLGIPDILHQQGDVSLSDLAEAAHAQPERLRQVMRLLYNNGIFTYRSQSDSYANNMRSDLLRSDHPQGWHNWVDLYGTQFYDIARGIPASLHRETTRSAAQHNFDTDDDMFTYFNAQGWLPRLHQTLGAGAIAQAPGILADYPWADWADETVLDIGGGGGALIASLLRQNPQMKGGVFDLASVIAHTKPFFQPGGRFEDVGARVASRDLIAGDFFDVIPSYKCYVMKWVLHDWLDPEAIKILKNIRNATAGPDSKLVVLESVLADGEMGRLSRYGDINMMMTTNGLERTVDDWQRLAAASRWRIMGIYDLRNAWVKAIEMQPAGDE